MKKRNSFNIFCLIFITTGFSFANAGENKCIGALLDAEAIFDSQKKNRDISSYGIKGIRGSIQMHMNSKDIKAKKRGSIKNIYSCSNYGMSVAEIDLILKVHHGYVTSNFSKIASECVSYIMFLETIITNKYSKKTGESIGFSLGKLFGTQLSTLNYLFPNKATNMNRVIKMAQHLNIKNNKSKFLNSCALMGIPAEAYYLATSITNEK